MPLVKDSDEIFYDRNTRDLVVGFEMSGEPINGAPIPRRFEVVMLRNTNNWSAKVYMGQGPEGNEGLNIAGNNVLEVEDSVPCARTLSN